MDKRLNKEDSYVERRKLFRDIWEAAMHMDAKGADLMSKPKVIKTLRLDEVDRINIGKTKKQRIKNLRNVCNRLLDFCDRQEADDRFYEQFLDLTPRWRNQLSGKVEEAFIRLSPSGVKAQAKTGEAKKKPKVSRLRRKVKKAKSCPPAGEADKPTTGGRDDLVSQAMKTACLSVNRLKRTTVLKKPTKNMNPKPSLIEENDPAKPLSGDAAARRKVAKIRPSKSKRVNKRPSAINKMSVK